jgi:hypothetical protein
MNWRQVPITTPEVEMPVLGSLFRRVAFWTAVLLPLTYLPLLAGTVSEGELTLLVALFAINVGCLLAGHSHAGER